MDLRGVTAHVVGIGASSSNVPAVLLLHLIRLPLAPSPTFLLNFLSIHKDNLFPRMLLPRAQYTFYPNNLFQPLQLSPSPPRHRPQIPRVLSLQQLNRIMAQSVCLLASSVFALAGFSR